MKLLKVKTTKKADADGNGAIANCKKTADNAINELWDCKRKLQHDAGLMVKILNGFEFDDKKYKELRGTISEVRFAAQELLSVLTNYEDDVDKAYKQSKGNAQ